MDIKKSFEALLEEFAPSYNVCGIVSTQGDVYPLGSDTKVLSTVFELFSRPIIKKFADDNGFDVVEPAVQNHYPDFTLVDKNNPNKKIAIDVKTTYISAVNKKFKFTLGGYTSFIRNNTKNIVFPFDQYQEHWVLGYVYTRVANKKAGGEEIFSIEDITKIPLPYKEVNTFFQEKWKISGDKAGSGNTTNIGSINGTLNDFKTGTSLFISEEEFLDYWRNYERTANERMHAFSNISEYRVWRNNN